MPDPKWEAVVLVREWGALGTAFGAGSAVREAPNLLIIVARSECMLGVISITIYK